MKNIQLNKFFVLIMLGGMISQVIIAESKTADNNHQQDTHEDKKKYYKILDVSENATQKEIEYAYHKIVDRQQAWVAYYKELQARRNEIQKEYDSERVHEAGYATAKKNPVLLKKQFGDQTIIIYGKQEQDYIPVYFGCSTHKDQWGNKYIIGTKTTIYDKKNDSKLVCSSRNQTIKEAREAFEALSGKKLEKIKLQQPQEINTDNLNQQRIYDYASKPDSTLEGLQEIINDERAKNNVGDIDTIVLGEDHQDLSLLSPEDQAKAQAALAERLEREMPQRYAGYGMNAAIGGGVVTVIALIVRAVCL